MITAKIVADSVAPSGVRLTTFVLVYPRFIHSELMTHRVFSRNASSSRAIPVKKQIQAVVDNPAIPIAFRENKPGMQAGAVLKDQDAAVKLWLEARDAAVIFAQQMSDMDFHKQYANRILEPWQHISVVLSSTDWSNWFALRYHHMAQPEICELAKQMWIVFKANKPDELLEGQWHLPFVSREDIDNGCYQGTNPSQELIYKSVAACARVSFNNHDGTSSTAEDDAKLYSRLLGSQPIHASPAEHQAIASSDPSLKSGNFRGWTQYRKTLEGENINVFVGPSEEVLEKLQA